MRCTRLQQILRVRWPDRLRFVKQLVWLTVGWTTTAESDEPCCCARGTMMGHSQLAVRFTAAGLRRAAARHRYIGGLALLVLLDTKAAEAASGCGMDLLSCWRAPSRSGLPWSCLLHGCSERT